MIRALADVSVDGCEKIYIDFDRSQVLVRTDIPEIAEFVRTSHSAMIAETPSNPVAAVDVRYERHGYSVDDIIYDVEQPPSCLFDEVRRKILQGFTSARADLLWVHAGAVRSGDQAVLIVGPSANGKSTLTTFLTQLGWLYMSDEAAPVRDDLTVLPYLRTPTRRLDPGRRLEGFEMGGFARKDWQVPEESMSRNAVKVGSVIFVGFEHGKAANVSDLEPGEAALRFVRSVLNFKSNPGPFIATIAEVASTIPCRSLTFGDGLEAAHAIQALGASLFGTT